MFHYNLRISAIRENVETFWASPCPAPYRVPSFPGRNVLQKITRCIVFARRDSGTNRLTGGVFLATKSEYSLSVPFSRVSDHCLLPGPALKSRAA